MTDNTQTPNKKSKTVRERLAQGVYLGKKAIVAGKIGLAAVVGGTSVYVYNQFHKSPEEIREETKVKMEESKKTVEEAIQKDLGTNSVAKAVSKAGGKIAETGASHGGAVRAWIAEKLQRKP